MIPLKLTIQGVYSYQDKEVIDFSRLTKAQLFGIFGATGSGKSTILEAISYALYGESERLNKRDNRGYNMMNLKSDRLNIDFEFAVEDDTYRFVVNGRRNSKQFDQVGTLTRASFKWEQNEWLPIEISDAEEIIGLSYDNFKRTIIIPQGKFQDFLQLSETDRTRMLKEIFKLEKYELFYKTTSLEKKNQTSITQLETLILQLEEVTPEALEDILQQLTTTEKQLESLQQDAKKLEKDLGKLENLKQTFEKISSQKKLVSELEAEESAIRERELSLKKYESCLIDFKPHLDRKKELGENIEAINANISSKKELSENSSGDLKSAQDSFQNIQQQYDQRDIFLKKAEELQLVISLKETRANIDALKGRVDKGTQMSDDLRKKIQNQKEELARKNATLRETREKRPDLNLLMQISNWFKEKENLLNEVRKSEVLVNEHADDLERTRQEQQNLLKNSSLEIAQYNLPFDQITTILKKDIEGFQKDIQQKEKEADTIRTRHHLKTFADNLSPGDPCPLCGSTHHPDIIETGNTEFELKRVEESIDQISQRLKLAEGNLYRLEPIHRQLTLQHKKLQESREKNLAVQAELDAHTVKFVWKAHEKSTAADIGNQIQEISRIDTLIDQLNQEREAFENSISREETELEKYSRTLDQLKSQLHAEEINFQTKAAGIRHLDLQTFLPLSNPQLEQAALKEKESHSRIENLYKTSEHRIQELRNHLSVLKGQISELEKQHHDTATKISQVNQRIDQQLEASSYTSLSQVEETLNQNLNINQEKAVISQFDQRIHSARATLAELQSLVEGKEFDADKLMNLQETLAQAKGQISDLMIHAGGLKKEAGRLEKDLAEKEKLIRNLEKLQLRGEDIRTLKSMFSRSGFVNYVSTIFLYNLCEAANDRFMKLTRGSLRLEATDNNSFQVRDYLNDGQTRSVKTLSGGQTFQAALSLALSLADHVQQQAKSKQNFFFLDEGFGSQDKHSLQIIFETLKSLRKENRIVGVISHVEELQQEIGAYLQIENHPETGSKVTGSWEG